MQLMLFACGLRGAIAYSLAINIPDSLGGRALEAILIS